jgi:beta-glucosidase
MGWPIDANGLFEVLTRLNRDYPELALIITESGAAFDDELVEGEVVDTERIDFFAEPPRCGPAAIAAGVDLRGYLVWSLLDNDE